MRHFGLLLAALVCASPGIVRAADYDDALERAHSAKQQAIATDDPLAWREALHRWQQADGLRPSADIKLEIARAALEIREDDLALEAYEAALALGITGKAKADAQSFVLNNAGRMGRIEIKGPKGARVFARGHLRGVLPREAIPVMTGSVTFRVLSEGQSVTEVVEVTAGEYRVIDLRPRFDLPVVGPPESKPAPKPPPSIADPDIAAQIPHELDKPPAKEDLGAGARALGWSLLIGGCLTTTAGLTLGIVSAALLDSRRSSLVEHCTVLRGSDRCDVPRAGSESAASADVDAISTWKYVGIGGFIAIGAGVTLGSIGGLRLLTAPAPPRSGTTWVAPSIARDGNLFVTVGGVL